MQESAPKEQLPVFEYLTLRRLVGIVAFALPWVVWVVSAFVIPPSISASYYTPARNIFVGSLFVIGTLLYAYQGHTRTENQIANVGALAAVIAALCPTTCDGCNLDLVSGLHLAAGATMFLVIAYFCLGPFRSSAKRKADAKAQRRAAFYAVCGWAILVCILLAAITLIPFLSELNTTLRLTFVVETIALVAFGFAWIVASQLKFLFWFVD